MQEVQATLRKLQISPRKVRLVADMIRGASVQDAQSQLAHSPKRAARAVLKLLNSAVANAENNHKMETNALTVKSIIVNEGVVLTRYKPRAFGRASTIRKRSSHIKIIVEGPEGKSSAKTEKKKDSPKKEEKKKTDDPNDLEKQPPEKKVDKSETEESKQVFPDPRMQGHEKKNQHMERKQKESPSAKKVSTTRTSHK